MKNKILSALFGSAMILASFCIVISAEEVATEAETMNSSEAVSETKGLSDDIYSFQMEWNGDLYEFPMTYTDFIAKGWTCKDDETLQLSPNSYTLCNFEKDGARATVDVLNLCQNTLAVSESDIVGFSVDDYAMEKAEGTSLVLPGGITFGVSTLDDITAAYGTPSDTYEGSLYTKVSYDYSIYQSVEIAVDLETGVVSDIDIQNMDDSKCATASMEVEVSDEIPENVLNYSVPEALSDDLYDYTVEYAGDLIKLPCPVSVFLANGWTIKDRTEETVAGKDSGWVYLMKDNQEMHTLAKNYEANVTTIENCFITSIKASEFGPDVTMVLPNGLGRDLNTAALEAALEGIDYTTEESSSFKYYNIVGKDSRLDGYQFCVNVDEDKITTIEMEYSPKTLN